MPLLRKALRTSFREAPQQSLFGRVLSFRVNVLPSSPPDASLKSRIDSIEHERSESEEQIFQNARSEAQALTSFVVGELQVNTCFAFRLSHVHMCEQRMHSSMLSCLHEWHVLRICLCELHCIRVVLFLSFLFFLFFFFLLSFFLVL